jgi:crotonobetainyl-CoA:carnitine CoA-transferase CaiB-like acyl-CoA transferase
MTIANPIFGEHALDGIKVIDLTRVLGGPYATQILADHGAEVIKIESDMGDEVRGWGPPFAREMASYFINVNRNKKSVVINLADDAGRTLLLRLLEGADVLIDNFKTGTLEKWGIGYDDVLRHRFPRLIHCRISGFGEEGPLAGAPGYDAVVQAMTGMMSINGMAKSGPVRLGAPIVDMGTGLYCAIGILMAIHERHRSGLGQYVDMTLYDSALALMHPHNANYFLSGKPGKASGNSHPNISPYDKFATATNDIFIGIGNNRAFRRFCEALGASEIADDPRFADNADRVVNRIALTGLIETALSEVDGAEFAERLLAAGIPAGPVRDVEEALTHPQTAARRMVIEKDDYTGISSPIKFSRSRDVGVTYLPPRLGEHSREVLRDAGLEEGEIEHLIGTGTVVALDAADFDGSE